MCILIPLFGALLLYGVWILLRKIYIKPIFDKIENADGHLLGITMNLIRVEPKNYHAKLTRYEAQYKVLKELNEYLLNSKCWIQNYLMTTAERNRYEKVYKDLVRAQKELVWCNFLLQDKSIGENTQILCADWFNEWFNGIR